MPTRVFNATHTGATSTKQMVTVQIDSGSKKEVQQFPPGYFKISYQGLPDPSAAHGAITVQAVNGIEKYVWDSATLQDQNGDGFASLQAAQIYLSGFFFEPEALAKVNTIQSQIDAGEIGGGPAYASDIDPASDNSTTFRIVPRLTTPTTEAGDGNGPYITGFNESRRSKAVTIGNNDHGSGDGFVVADGGASFAKVGTGTAQLKINTDKSASGDKLLSPRTQPYFGAVCLKFGGIISPDTVKGNAGGAFGCKMESPLTLKVNERLMLDKASWSVTTDSQSIQLQTLLGGASYTSGNLYGLFWGRDAAGAVMAGIGLIPDETLDLSNLAIAPISSHASQFQNADFSEWVIELGENAALYEFVVSNGAWNVEDIKSFYRYFVSEYGQYAP